MRKSTALLAIIVEVCDAGAVCQIFDARLLLYFYFCVPSGEAKKKNLLATNEQTKKIEQQRIDVFIQTVLNEFNQKMSSKRNNVIYSFFFIQLFSRVFLAACFALYFYV
jgi:hypothetical protein